MVLDRWGGDRKGHRACCTHSAQELAPRDFRRVPPLGEQTFVHIFPRQPTYNRLTYFVLGEDATEDVCRVCVISCGAANVLFPGDRRIR
jgi:hypothetical protein